MLKRLSIKYKIGFIALVGLVGFVVFQTAHYRLSVDIRDNLQSILTKDFSILKFSNDIQVDFSELDKFYQASLAEADMDTLLDADAKATKIKLRFELMRGNYDLKDAYFDELQKAFNAYVDQTSKHTASVLTNTLSYEKTLSGYAEISLLRERYQEVQSRFLEDRYKSFKKHLEAIAEEEEYIVKFGLILGLVLSTILIVFSAIIIRGLILAFSNAVNVAEQVASGNLDQEIEIFTEDETGKLMQSLYSMRDALKKQNEENHYREKIQGFLAGLNETMRGDKSLEELGAAILKYLVTELHAQVGAFYLLDQNRLNMLASYAYAKSDTGISFELGETLVGQIALEQRARIITDLPEQYMKVGTGLGKALPRSVMLFPVVFEGNLNGVLELAAFHRFSDDDLYLLRRCNDAMAISISSAQSRFKVASMLEQTQEQAHELKKQRQELALFNQQLEGKTQDLDRQKNEILKKNIELETSERRLIEKSEALELSGKYKSQFLSTMSHELRTPLNSILILSEALMGNREGRLNEKDIEHSSVIHAAGADLLALINDILDLSKVEEGKMEVVIDEINPRDLKSSLVQQFEYMAKSKDLEFVVNVDESLPLSFYTDRHRLKQIIKNFISNALKFTEKGGVYIDIMKPEEASISTGSLLTPANSLMFKVRDTGIGIEKDKQAYVFEAFKQVDGTTSRKFGGTGLGLTISKELAKLLGGEIYLYSDGEGQGSIFTLLIPLGSKDMLSAQSSIHAMGDEDTDLVVIEHDDLHNKNHHIAQFDDFLIITKNTKVADLFIKEASVAHMAYHWVKTFDAAIQRAALFQQKLVYVDFTELGKSRWQNLAKLKSIAEMIYVAAAEQHKKKIIDMHLTYIPENPNKKMIHSIFEELSIDTVAQVLIVEDNPVFYEVLRTVFAKARLPVSIVVNGSDALSRIKQFNYKCLVIDLSLPDFSGLDLLKKIRSNKNYKNSYLIVFTAEDLTQERRKEILQYANKIILKTPKAAIKLCDEVRNILYKDIALLTTAQDDLHIAEHTYKHGMLEGRRILLVDDDKRNLYSISAALEEEGVYVEAVSSGAEALAILKKQNNIDIILLDIMMPEMDGYEVLRQIRMNPLLKHLPVIAVTAKAMVGDKEKCIAAGASDYLSKPVDIKVLITCIYGHISHAENTANL